MSEKKIKRVSIEWDDGSIQSLEGKDAEDWNGAVASQATFCYVHGVKFPELPWKWSRTDPVPLCGYCGLSHSPHCPETEW